METVTVKLRDEPDESQPDYRMRRSIGRRRRHPADINLKDA